MKFKAITLLFFTAIMALAQVAYPTIFGVPWQSAIGLRYLSMAGADVTTTTSYVDELVLSNVTGGAITVTIADKSTNCGGAACQIWPVVSIAANTIYTAEMGGIAASGGVHWAASADTSVEG